LREERNEGRNLIIQVVPPYGGAARILKREEANLSLKNISYEVRIELFPYKETLLVFLKKKWM